MANRFKENTEYSGENLYGGCGRLDYSMVTVLKRTRHYITYKEKIGKVKRAKREYAGKWGEYFSTPHDRFFAYSVAK